MRLRVAALASAAAVALAACGVLPPLPEELDTEFIPATSAPLPPEYLSADGFSAAQHLAVRIRTETCDGYFTGSGWILNDHQVVTNRHVILDAIRIEVTTYDGRDYRALSSVIAPVADLGLITLEPVFEEWASFESRQLDAGDEIVIVGYPEGEQLTVEEGFYTGLEDDYLDDTGEQVWDLHASVKPGSSGSAVYDETGTVVAVLHGGDDYNLSLAWPVEWLEGLLDDPESWKPNRASC